MIDLEQPTSGSAFQQFPASLRPEYPTTYTFELTAACNHQCVGCGNVFVRQMRHLSGESWTHLLDILASHISSLRITGGECTLHPDFEAILRAVDALGVPIVIFTSGNWQNPQKTVELLARCQNLEGILVSLHGHHPDAFAAFTRVNSFEHVTKNIAYACQQGIRVATNTLLLRSTVEHIEDIARLSFELGTVSAAFSRYYGKPLPEFELSAVQLGAALKQLAALRRDDPRYTLNNCVPTCFIDSGLPTKGCTSGFTHCTIDPLGNVRPCTHAPFVLGNSLTQDITEIWASEALREWRNRVPEICMSCSVLHQCRGGCRATAYQQNLEQDPLIRTPLSHWQDADTKLKLYRQARPVPNYTLQPYAGGINLVDQNNHLISVSPAALPILQALDGQTTLNDLQARFGKSAVDFVGTLAIAGLIEFR